MKRLLIGLLALALVIVPFSAFAQEGDETPVIETFVTEDGSFLTVFPDGWAADGSAEEGLTIANDPAILEAMANDEEGGPASGQFALLIFPLPADMMDMMVGEDAAMSDILTTFIGLMASEEDPDMPVFGEATELIDEELEFEGVVAYGANDKFDAAILAYDLAPATYGISLFMAAPGELADFEEIAMQIVALTAFSPALDASYTAADGLTLSYPAAWLVVEEGVVTVTSEELDMESEDVILESGQYAVSFLNLTALGIPGATLEEMADLVLTELLDEGDEANDPLRLVIGEDEILLISVDNETENEGGLILYDQDGTVYAAVYAGPNGESGLVGYLAASMLLSIGGE